VHGNPGGGVRTVRWRDEVGLERVTECETRREVVAALVGLGFEVVYRASGVETATGTVTARGEPTPDSSAGRGATMCQAAITRKSK